MSFVFIDPNYKIRSNFGVHPGVYCYPYRDFIDQTLSEAKHRCNVDPLCAVVYDATGEGSGIFVLCNNDAAFKKSDAGSRLYIKQGNILVVLYLSMSVVLVVS